MCYLIYLSLIALALYYSDYLLSQYLLAVQNENGILMSVATGWETVIDLWPVFLLAMIAGSAVTFFTVRWLFKRR